MLYVFAGNPIRININININKHRTTIEDCIRMKSILFVQPRKPLLTTPGYVLSLGRVVHSRLMTTSSKVSQNNNNNNNNNRFNNNTRFNTTKSGGNSDGKLPSHSRASKEAGGGIGSLLSAEEAMLFGKKPQDFKVLGINAANRILSVAVVDASRRIRSESRLEAFDIDFTHTVATTFSTEIEKV